MQRSTTTISSVCTILLLWRCHPAGDVILAANRDELVSRPSDPPGVLLDDPRVYGGRDRLAGGTWLALTPDGRVAAVTHRHPEAGDPVTRDPARRSRGEIPVALLGDRNPDVRLAMEGLGGGLYNPVNVVWASATRALVAHLGDAGPAEVVELAPGPHVLTVGDVDDLRRPKVAALSRQLAGAGDASGSADQVLTRLRGILSSHDSPTGDAVDAACIHGDVYGTVSSSTVVIDAAGVRYAHAPGRPCVTPFSPVPIGGA